MNSILENQESLSDFKKSINLVSNNIEEVCSSKVYLSHKLKINVDEDYEVILTHYPLWNNEPFLYMICDKHSKNIIEKEYTECVFASGTNVKGAKVGFVGY